MEILDTFLETQLTKIPRNQNLHAHSLATFASTCKLPFKPNHLVTAEIKHRLAVPDNVKNWQLFENDTQINNFLTLKEEFSSTKMDTNTIEDSNQMDKVETHIYAETVNQILHPTKFTKTDLQELSKKEGEDAIIAECEVIELKDNFLPIGLTPLEDIFDSNDISRTPKM